MPAGGGWDETTTSYRYRIRDPDNFAEGSFKTISFGSSGIKAVIGKLPGKDDMTLQSLIFPKDMFTEEQAKKWLKEHPEVKKRETEVGENMDFEIYVPISKLDDEQQIVFGWGSVTRVNQQPYEDLQGDIIEDYELEKAVYDFMLAPKHDEMHERIVPDSQIVESFVVTDEKLRKMFPGEQIPQGKRGWWIGIKINDPEVYAKHKAGIYTGFSITGSAVRKEV